MMSNTTSALQHLIDEAQRLPSTTPRDVMRFAIAGYLIGALKYDPNQPRDDSGQWTDTGGSGGDGESSANIGKTIKDTEDSISKIKDHEEACVISSSGDVIMKKSGGKTSIDFSDDDISKMNGAIITHNHPQGGSFSQEDLYLASMANVSEIRAVGTTEKAVYSIKLTDPKKGWPPKDKIKQVRDEKIAPLLEIYRPQVQSGKISKEDAAIILQNRLWTRVAQDQSLNLTYTRAGL